MILHAIGVGLRFLPASKRHGRIDLSINYHAFILFSHATALPTSIHRANFDRTFAFHHFRPKSIYGMLLTGDNVLARHHPLLMESKGRYLNVDHGFGSASLLHPKDHVADVPSLSDSKSDKSPVPFVIEAFVDLKSKEGQQMVLDFIEAMVSLPQNLGGDKSGDSISAGYRIVPVASPDEYSPVTKVLAQARQLDASTLKAFVSASLGKDDSDDIESILSSISKLDG